MFVTFAACGFHSACVAKIRKHVAEATNVKQTLDLDGHPTKRELAIPYDAAPLAISSASQHC